MAASIMSYKNNESFNELDNNSMNSISSPNSNTNGENSNQESLNTSNNINNNSINNLNNSINKEEHQQQLQQSNHPKVEIPRLSSYDLRPQRPHSPCQEMEQFGFLFCGHGSAKEPNKVHISKTKLPELEEGVKRAKKYAMEQSVRHMLVKQQQQQQKQQLDLIKKQQALLLMCRIYVGSIFYEVKEETVRASFSPFGPIRSISMSWDAATNKHKGFAFIEFETPEAAQLALDQMNGALLGGRNIKVGRPSNMPQAQPIIDQLGEEAKNYNRIYLSSIHPDLSETDVQSVFEAFGKIKSCQLTRDAQTGKHKGYGFIEYETGQAAQDAISSMNQFDLGGQYLRVGKAVTAPEGVTLPQQPTTPIAGQIPTAAVLAAANISAQIQASEGILNPLSHVTSITTTSSTSSLSNLTTSTFATTTPVATAIAQLNQTAIPTTAMDTTPAPTVTIQQPVQQQQPQQPQIVQTQPVQAQISQPMQALDITKDQLKTSTSSSSLPILPAGVASQQSVELTENQKKLLGMTSADDPFASLEQQIDVQLKGKEQRLLLMQKLMQRKPESKVLILRNMVGPDDVDEYLESEITEECGKYGEVEQVVIYKEKQGEEEDAETIVKIFVEFTTSLAVTTAVNSLNGRYFGGRIVKAEIYDQSAYYAKDYSG